MDEHMEAHRPHDTDGDAAASATDAAPPELDAGAVTPSDT